MLAGISLSIFYYLILIFLELCLDYAFLCFVKFFSKCFQVPEVPKKPVPEKKVPEKKVPVPAPKEVEAPPAKGTEHHPLQYAERPHVEVCPHPVPP